MSDDPKYEHVTVGYEFVRQPDGSLLGNHFERRSILDVEAGEPIDAGMAVTIRDGKAYRAAPGERWFTWAPNLPTAPFPEAD